MNKLFLTGALCLSVILLGSHAQAAEGKWLTNYEEAKAIAAKENKVLLMDFTGSDWCGWCKKLNKEVFSTPEFIDYANKNLVLLEVDFPQQKPQTEPVKKQNQALAKDYQIEGFPTIVVVSAQAKKLGQLGYEEGGPSQWISELEKITKAK